MFEFARHITAFSSAVLWLLPLGLCCSVPCLVAIPLLSFYRLLYFEMFVNYRGFLCSKCHLETASFSICCWQVYFRSVFVRRLCCSSCLVSCLSFAEMFCASSSSLGRDAFAGFRTHFHFFGLRTTKLTMDVTLHEFLV